VIPVRHRSGHPTGQRMMRNELLGDLESTVASVHAWSQHLTGLT
jgi:hypothetical protein